MTIEIKGSTSRSTSSFVDTRSFVAYLARVTVKHWQLRDLVCKTSTPHEVIYVSDHFVKTLDLSNGRRGKCAEFTFDPQCIASAHGIVAAGGVMRGQLGITYRTTPSSGATAPAPVYFFELGGYINNSITIFRRPGAPQGTASALVCNNDHTLRILDIADARHSVVDAVQMPVPLNHASISPDQKTIVACGDSAHVFVFHPEEGLRAARMPDDLDETTRVDLAEDESEESSGHKRWKPSATLGTSSDAGFSTAFSPSGVLFAVASQDGVASVYDSRQLSNSSSAKSPSSSPPPASSSQRRRNSQRPLKYIESTRPLESSGAFRSLKFSSGTEDLLLIAEQTGRVHVVDTRRLEYKQVLNIPVTRRSGSGSGPEPSSSSSSRRRSRSESADEVSEIERQGFRQSTSIWGGGSRASGGTVNRSPFGPAWTFTNTRMPHLSSSSASASSSSRAWTGREETRDRYQFEDEDGYYDDEDMGYNYCATDGAYESGSDSALEESTSSTSLRSYFRYTWARPLVSSTSGSSGSSGGGIRREKDISGLAWSEDDGGSIIVGWDGGIGKWTIDSRGRRVFPSYIMR